MASEIVDRLREGKTPGSHLRWQVTPLHIEAADHIEALERKVAELEAEREPATDELRAQVAGEINKIDGHIKRLERRIDSLESALRPFNTGWADENGWTDTACQSDRIVDWFGPSDFRAVAAVLSKTKAPDPKPFTFSDPVRQAEWERQRKERER